MSTTLTQNERDASHPPPAGSAGDAVWNRVWQHAPSHSKDRSMLDRERRSPRWKRIVGELTREYGAIAGLRTIELGSGRGDLSVLLAQHGARVTLVDHSQSALDAARERFQRLGLKAEYCRGNLLGDLSGWRDRFDVSLSSGVIEHFTGKDRSQAIDGHRKVLRRGGCTIISVPHSWCLPYRFWKMYLELRGWWPYGLEQPYSKREITDRAIYVGFQRITALTHSFWQSVGDHWIKGLLKRNVDWSTHVSRLDEYMGLLLLMIAYRDR